MSKQGPQPRRTHPAVHNVLPSNSNSIGSDSNEVRPGGLIDLDLGELAPGTYEFYCDIADHVSRGMVAEFTVVDDTVSEAVPAT